MKRRIVKISICAVAAMFAFSGSGISADATMRAMLSADMEIMTRKNESLMIPFTENVVYERPLTGSVLVETVQTGQDALAGLSEEEAYFHNLVIAQVNNYVNVRSLPGEEGEIIGKLYDNSVGEFVSEENGWYRITSGTVTGYVKAEYCVTGEAAIEIAKQVRKRIATVTTQTLFVRKEPTTEAGIMGMVPEADELVVLEEAEGWVKVDVEGGIGWVSADYVTLHNEFVHAESKEEEARRLAREEKARKKAQEAAKVKQNNKKVNSTNKNNASQVTQAQEGTDPGRSVADYALQFVGNPYVYGGVSLTDGADCSGFVQSVYAQYGVSLPRTSASQRSSGYAVDGLSEAKAGDLICYSGHIGIYIGDGKIVHASSEKTGIIVSQADYRKVLAVRRIF